MRGFRSGTFNRDQVPKPLRRFSPVEALHELEEVNLDALKEAGKTVLLLDVDNTLLPWRSEEIPDSTLGWVAKAKSLGMSLCVLSNTRHPARLERICARLEIPFLRDRFKPSRRMYLMALEKFGATPGQAVMVGDQLLTDIWGANRTGIDALWVKPIQRKEFVGTTLVSRNIERVIGRFLYRYFQADAADVEGRPGFFRHEVFLQLLKFGLVGGTATVVDLGLHYFLMFKAQSGGEPVREIVGAWAIRSFGLGWPLDEAHLRDAAYGPLKIGPVMLAILVSYFLNRIYTFNATHQKVNVKQMAQFYTVALIGMVISVAVGTMVNRIADASPMFDWATGSFFGTLAGFVWNFNGQRLWTFRKK